MKQSHAGYFHALTGLRGIAALIVVIHHSLLVDPGLASAYGGTNRMPPSEAWFVYSPLHLIWEGTEAVYVFFLLSGFALMLPFLRANKPSWVRYYPKRLARLYLPVWGSLVLAWLSLLIAPRVSSGDMSWWINNHDQPLSIREALLPSGYGWLNSPLWSIRWEIIFSALLPAYWFISRRLHRFWLPVTVVLLAAVGFGTMAHIDALKFLPMFGIGALMAVRRETLQAWALRLSRLQWAALVIGALVLLNSNWTFRLPGSTVLATVGGAVLIFAFLYHNLSRRIGEAKVIQWLGKRSFSLYLVHEPIVVSMALLLQITNPIVELAVAVPVSLLVAELFFRLVESPSHKLADWIGQRRLDAKESSRDARTGAIS